MTKLSKRVLDMEESVTLAAGARAKALRAQGRDILSLTLGEPDFITPKIFKTRLLNPFEMANLAFTRLLQDFQN